jgi:glycosyltransferase involved in cell wall biosynthesis
MPLTVLSIGYPLAPVAENTAGGAEHILALLDDELVAAGHRSLVIAPEDSHCRGTLLPVTVPSGQLDEGVQRVVWERYSHAIQSCLARHSVDVVHMHGIDFVEYLPTAGVPVVVTLHLPPSWYPARAYSLNRPDTYLVCVSDSQAKSCPPAAQVRVIRNGVKLDECQPAGEKDNYVLALGRICPEKGYHLALDAATQAGVPLILAGQVFGYKAHEEYFETMIHPRVVKPHRFLGPVGAKRKQELMARALCVLVPSLVEETSCLVAMEALACGTPVIAFRRGALAEIVEHGRTGFLVDTASEMAEAIPFAANLSSAECRKHAEKAFSATIMVQRYLSLYAELAGHTGAESLSQIGMETP